MLNLEHNQIHIVSSNAFDGQARLRLLSLSHNRIEKLHQEIFINLENLTSLSMDHNQLEAFEMVLKNNTLKDLALSNNRLKSVPEFIRECRQMTTLDLGDNNIQEITGDDFNSLTELYGLKLAGNRIKTVGNDTFVNTTNLHLLNLARYYLQQLSLLLSVVPFQIQCLQNNFTHFQE